MRFVLSKNDTDNLRAAGGQNYTALCNGDSNQVCLQLLKNLNNGQQPNLTVLLLD